MIEASTRSVSMSAVVCSAPSGAAARSRSGTPRRSATLRQDGPGDRLRADLRQPAGAVALGLQQRVDVRGDREPQDAVAQERQARVGVRPPCGPRGVGEDLAGQVCGNLVEKCVQLLQRTGSWSSRAAGRVGEDEVDRLTHGEDLRGLLVGHLHAVGVLELLDQRVEVERVGLQILLEAGAFLDPRGSTSSSSARWFWMRVKTASRVMALAR